MVEKFLDGILSFIANILVAVGVEPTTEAILATLVILFILLLALVSLIPVGRSSIQRKRMSGKPVQSGADSTNGLVHFKAVYPYIFRLHRQGKEGEEFGWYVKLRKGEEAWLQIVGTCFRLFTICRVNGWEEKASIERSLKPDPVKRDTFGCFSLNGAEWRVLNSLSLVIQVVAGTSPYFSGIKGEVDYLFARSEKGEEKEFIILEDIRTPGRPLNLRTWVVYSSSRVSREEFQKVLAQAREKTQAPR